MGRDRRQAIVLACTVALLLAGFHRGGLSGGDEFGVYETARSLVERGTLEVGPIPHSYEGRDGRRFHQYAVGQALLAVPFYKAGALGDAHLPRAWVLALAPREVELAGQRHPGSVAHFAVGLFAPLVTGVLIAVFYLFQRSLGVTRGTATVVSLLTAATTYVASLSTFFLRHPTETVLVLAAFYAYHRFATGGTARSLFVGSLLLSLTVLVRVPAGLAGVPLGAYLLWCLREKLGAGGPATWSRAVLAVGVPAAAVLAVHLLLNDLRWGGWFDSPMFAERARFGTPLSLSGYAFLFSPGMSVFVYSPLLVLAPAAWLVLYRRRRAEALAIAGYAALFWLVFSRYDSWTGLWSAPGPRYLYSLVPLLLLPLGLWLDQGGRGRWLAVGALATAGGVLQVALMVTSWPRIVTGLQYAAYDPPLGFLFYPLASPPFAALTYLFAGELNDTWIAAVAGAWPSLPIRPWVAPCIVAVWSLCLAALLALLARNARAGGDA